MKVEKMERGKIGKGMTLAAMALDIQNGNHPNKMPFSGVLTYVDRPSDAPPEGSGGRLVTITREAAEGSLHTLMGMAVNYTPNFDGHAPQSKIGIITSADVVGNEVKISGFIYASDFPAVAAAIKANKDRLGFSYDCRDIFCDDPDANPVRITECVFTGAAILFKAKAAYKQTSLAANAALEVDIPSSADLQRYIFDEFHADDEDEKTERTTPEMYKEPAPRLPHKLDFAATSRVMGQLGLPFPMSAHAQASPRNAGNPERVTGFKYDRALVDEAMTKANICLDDRIYLKSALASLGVLD